MARTKALYDGHAVAAVAAVDARTAKQALKLIVVDYEVLPHVTDVDEAMQASAPVLQRHCLHGRRRAQAPQAIERRQAQPSSAMAMWRRASARPTSSSSAPSRPSRRTRAISSRMPASPASVPTAPATCGCARRGISSTASTARSCSGMDVSKLRVTSSEIGGGFGGKTHVWAEPVALALSRKAGQAGQAGDDARRGVSRLGADERDLDRRQDRRHARTARSPRRRRPCATPAAPMPASGPSSGR